LPLPGITLSKAPSNRSKSAIQAAALLSVLFWLVPALDRLLLPLVYLNVHIHEWCHAVMAIATGGAVQHIMVYAQGNGVTPVSGGSLPLVAAAGYLGASAIGGWMQWSSRTEAGARLTLKVVGTGLAVSLLIWVRGDLVGVLTGILWAAALWFAALKFSGDALVFVAQFIGLQQCINSIQSVLTLYQLTAYGETQSDAGILANATGTSPIFWAVLWCGISLAVVIVSLRRAWSSPSPKPSRH